MNLGSVESFSVSPLTRGLCLGFFALVQFANTLDLEAGLAVATAPIGADFLADVVAFVVVETEAFRCSVGGDEVGFEDAEAAWFICVDVVTFFSFCVASFEVDFDVEGADIFGPGGGGGTAFSIGSPNTESRSECWVTGRLPSETLLVILEKVLRLFASGCATPFSLIGEVAFVLERFGVSVVGILYEEVESLSSSLLVTTLPLCRRFFLRSLRFLSCSSACSSKALS